VKLSSKLKIGLSLLWMGTYGTSVQAQTTILLTGAAGFIGSNFLKYMFAKYPDYQFIILDNLTYAGNLNNFPAEIKNSPRFEFFYGSVTNQSVVDLLMQRSDLVVHFAAESHVTNSIYEDKVFFETDVDGTRTMMRSLIKYRDKVQRFVHISTSEVYGTAETVPMTEDHPLNPRSPYAAAKTGADRLVYAYWCTYDLPVTILRPFNNYGTNQHIEKLIPLFITNALRGKKLTVHGQGTQMRDWVHTTDTARAIDLALHTTQFDQIKQQVINIGTGKGISILEIAQKISKIMQLPADAIEFVGDRPGQVDCHISSTERAKKLLGWQAEKDFDTELAKIIDWYTANPEWWEKATMVVPYLMQNSFLNLQK
jgi:dTDP-glucose 4,6-dehydratase